MNAFLVELENRPGELARICEAIAAKGINITAVSGASCGSSGRVAIMTADDAGTRTALNEARCSFMEHEGTEVGLRNEPGTLARATRRLADEGINIEALLATGMHGNEVMITFVTDQPAKAREALHAVGSTSR